MADLPSAAEWPRHARVLRVPVQMALACCLRPTDNDGILAGGTTATVPAVERLAVRGVLAGRALSDFVFCCLGHTSSLIFGKSGHKRPGTGTLQNLLVPSSGLVPGG